MGVPPPPGFGCHGWLLRGFALFCICLLPPTRARHLYDADLFHLLVCSYEIWAVSITLWANFSCYRSIARYLHILIVVSENLLAQEFFKVPFLLFVSFNIMLGRHICLTRSSNFLIYK